jgi:hypothetical protein
MKYDKQSSDLSSFVIFDNPTHVLIEEDGVSFNLPPNLLLFVV